MSEKLTTIPTARLEEIRELAAKKRRPQLQRLIDRAVEANRRVFEAETALNQWCENIYGLAPPDVTDADEIIDAVYGAIGLSDGMLAERFHAIMVRAVA